MRRATRTSCWGSSPPKINATDATLPCVTSLKPLSHRIQHLNSSHTTIIPLSNSSAHQLSSNSHIALTPLSSNSQTALISHIALTHSQGLSKNSYHTIAITVSRSGYALIISQSHARLSLPRRDNCNGCTNAINATHVLIEGYTLLLSQGEFGRIASSPKGRESQLARQ
jgi:hypothetical protein